MKSLLLDDWIADPTLPVFKPERRDPAMTYFALRCSCQGELFRLAGWPRLAAGRGAYFWRTLARVWREARQSLEAGEPVESPFLLPLGVQCDRCGRTRMLFDVAAIVGRVAETERGEPRESHRCRVCRRAIFELVAGLAVESDQIDASACAVELVARCHACHRQARLAWADMRPGPQQIRLDRLYGRR